MEYGFLSLLPPVIAIRTAHKHPCSSAVHKSGIPCNQHGKRLSVAFTTS